MKNIKIKEMTLYNFKGQNAHHVFGDINRCSGRNGSGKSTIIKAWNWLLCGQCDANSVANADLYDNRKPITPDTPTACVEVVIDIDGNEYTLKRTATAAFTRKRGTSEMIKSASDSYAYFIDNVSYNATEYRDWLSVNIASDDMLKYVLSGDYFVNLVFSDKKKSRAIIEKTVGTVERSEMNGDYADIDELLGKYSPDQIEERCKNLSKSIDARLNEIPTVISQKEAEISDIEQTDFTAVQNEIDTLESEQKSVEAQIFDYAARMKPLLEAKSNAEHDKQMKQSVYDKAKKVYMQGLIDTENGIIREIAEAEDCNRVALKNIEEAETDLTIQQNFVAHAESELAKLREERDRIKETKEEVCPVCGNAVSGEKLEEHKRKAIDDIVSHAKGLSDELDKAKEKIELINTYLNGHSLIDIEPLKQKLINFRTNDSIVPFELTEQGKSLQADIDSVVIPEVKMPEDAELKQKVADIKEKLKGLYMKKGLQSRLSSLKNDIDELRIEQREKGAELAKYERQRQLVKEYKQEQMEILSHKVNDGLKSSYIECWSQQKDGTMVADIVLKNAEGINFATANGASRIITTCDIQRFFCEKLGVSMPVFIDESSIIQTSNLPHFDGVQTFYLFCSDESLKIETR
jgi:DNA repair exonuclease SbcCD ATPase subunit